MQPVGPPILKGYDITKNEYIETNRAGGIVRLGLHVSCPTCNLSCPYCLNGRGTHYVKNNQTGSVSVGDRKSWILQAYELGARCFVIDGIYEPLANETETLELLDYIRSLGVTPILITNMTYMDERIVKHLAELRVSVLGKLNVPMAESDHPNYRTYSEVQAYLTGGNSTVYERLKNAIHLLMQHGFNEKEISKSGRTLTRLGIETVITPQNVEYIPELVGQMRALNIYVHGETVKPQGAASGGEFTLAPERVRELYQSVYETDRRMGYEPERVNPVYVSGKCLKHMGTFNININGDVILCPSVELAVGNLKKDTLRDIIQNNEYVRIVRNLQQYIRGDCRDCELMKNYECYGGCRGYTYMYLRQKGYDIHDALVASDPSCWRVKNIL